MYLYCAYILYGESELVLPNRSKKHIYIYYVYIHTIHTHTLCTFIDLIPSFIFFMALDLHRFFAPINLQDDKIWDDIPTMKTNMTGWKIT